MVNYVKSSKTGIFGGYCFYYYLDHKTNISNEIFVKLNLSVKVKDTLLFESGLPWKFVEAKIRMYDERTFLEAMDLMFDYMKRFHLDKQYLRLLETMQNGLTDGDW